MQRYRSTHSYYFLRVWLLLFAVIWLAGLGIIFSVIRSNDSAVQELNMHYSRLMVDQTVDVKAFIQAFDDMGKLLTESGLFQQLSTASKEMVSKEQIDAAMEEAKGIYNWNAAYPYKQVAFVYLPQNGLLFDFPSWQVFTDKNKVLPFLNMSEASWERLLDVKNEILVDTVFDGDMSFARLMVSKDLTEHMIFVTGISEYIVSDMLKTNQLPDGSQIMLLTQGSQAITYANEQTEVFACPYEWEELQSLPDVSIEKLDGVSYYQYHVTLMDGALHQLAFVPADWYGTVSWHTIWLIAAVIWLGGIPATWVLAKAIYRPVRKWMSRQTKQYQTQMNQQQKRLDELLFLQTMKGQCEMNDAFLNICLEKGLLDPEEHAVLALFAVKIDTVNGRVNAQELVQNYEYLDGQKQAFEMALQQIAHYLVNDGNVLFGFLSFRETDEDTVFDILDRVRKEMCGQEEPTVSVLVSTRFRRIDYIPSAYNEILELQHDMDWTGEYDVRKDYAAFQSEEQKRGTGKDLCGLIQTMSLQIQNGAFSAAGVTVQSICEQIASEPQHFSGNVSIEAAFAASGLLQALEQWNAAKTEEETAECAEQIKLWGQLENVTSVAALKRHAANILNSFPEQENAKTETELYMERAVSYIHDHYRDPMLSAGEVAQIVGMQPSVFSKAFKQYMKVPYLEYIHRLRIEAAKKYLGSCTLSEVAEKVGYTNTVTMNRAFKRYENTTPGNVKSGNIG